VTKVIVNGTFDIVHRAHIEMLNYAKSLGDYLLVAIDTDFRVKELKGLERPINDEYDRKFLLENLKSVDKVVFFDSKDELIEIIDMYKPDIMVKGSDYKGKSVVGAQNVPQVVYYDRIEKYSTTQTIQRIVDRG
jgi:D-beta-D-heptose 7-phosphate kinase/D-beta-D-heptose 1-phosphate adenosyltransferase